MNDIVIAAILTLKEVRGGAARIERIVAGFADSAVSRLERFDVMNSPPLGAITVTLVGSSARMISLDNRNNRPKTSITYCRPLCRRSS